MNFINRLFGRKTELASPASTPTKAPGKAPGYHREVKLKSISRTRKDIDDWKKAMQEADKIENGKRYKLTELYNDIMLDALLTSQVEQRITRTLGSEFALKDEKGAQDDEATKLLQDANFTPAIFRAILESIFHGPTLIEFEFNQFGNLTVCTLPRQNMLPKEGILLYDAGSEKGLLYRECREFGTWLHEFGNPSDYGLLNKAVPHILFKRFAQSCWSELCEIYGIPPRYIKTNTEDPDQIDRAEKMMRNMGSAAWMVIDTEEEFGFADGLNTSGDVYSNLISLCNSEVSLLISGAQIGQDTKNGNRSKEETSIKQLEKFTNSDKRYVEDYMNTSIMPALAAMGIIKPGLRFAFKAEENIQELWKMTTEALVHYDVDPEWVKDKFGIQITGAKKSNDDFFE